MPPNSMEMVRRRFLQLPQLQKTLVFGGLGMLSGWVATGGILAILLYADSQSLPIGMIIPVILACLACPGLAFGLLVTGPLETLRSGTLARWMGSLSGAIILHPAAFVISLATAGPVFTSNEPHDTAALLPMAIVGGVFGYMMTWICRGTSRKTWTLGAAATAVAAVMATVADAQLSGRFSGVGKEVSVIMHLSPLFVTLHCTIAASLSWQDWPTIDRMPQPPLDEPATLPP
ncbi:hypothetical protein [Planctellipticum variicoloris]|uniref:hypothetical protein n=1 Tax=Planctellipticum variicoloris TaxID=3064265 RepID=UPI003013DFFC|nr:hypothetical protein SH412_004698 [Planctomycetaceae bacterium SH412]